MKEDMMLKGIIYNDDQTTEETVTFDVKKFYEIIRFDMNSENVGNMLQLMYDSMGSNFEKKRTRGSTNRLQKVQSLQQRWFAATSSTLEKLPKSNVLS